MWLLVYLDTPFLFIMSNYPLFYFQAWHKIQENKFLPAGISFHKEIGHGDTVFAGGKHDEYGSILQYAAYLVYGIRHGDLEHTGFLGRYASVLLVGITTSGFPAF
jgi:hypothetical protein